MKIYKYSKSIILLALMASYAQANSNGVYVGLDASLITLGEDSMNVEKKDKSRETYHEISGSSYNLKVGYQHFDGNRVELYYRHHELDAKEGDFSTESIGLNYEWGFSSLASEKWMPYVAVGFGAGEVSSSKLKSIDNSDMAEATLGFGVRYQFTKNIDGQVGYKYTSTVIDNFQDETTDEISEIGQNNIMFAVNYKF